MMFRFSMKGQPNQLRKVLNILPIKDQKKIFQVMILQVFMGFVDLLGVGVVGIIGALAVSGIQSNVPGSRVNWFLSFFKLENLTFQTQVAVLGVFATLILIFRTIFSVVFTKRTLYFLSRRGALLTANLLSRLLSQPLIKIQQYTSQDLVYALTTGVNSITLGVIGNGVILISDLSLLMVLGVGLVLIDFRIAVLSIGLFSVISMFLYILMHSRSEKLGKESSEIAIKSNELIIEVITAYRESVVRNRRDYYFREIGKLRSINASNLAELAFMPNVSKYVIEITVVVSALGISAAQFWLTDASHAIATLTIFLAAGTRIAPAFMRLQQGALQIKSSLGIAIPTLRLIDSLGNLDTIPKSEDKVSISHIGFHGKVEITNVNLRYPGQENQALNNISFTVNEGSSTALVGASGAGKTSLADIILGVIEPSSGKVEISGLTPNAVVTKWPGVIGYVPQDVVIINGSIRQNVAFGFPNDLISDELVMDAIIAAQLQDFLKTLKNGLESQVGERGTKISGGQRQRIGVARALYTKPKLLVLDEATSALDGETESNINNAIQSLRGKTTILVIAHRLSTIRNFDQIIYMEKGRIISKGNFKELRDAVPDFDKQAKLMGL